MKTYREFMAKKSETIGGTYAGINYHDDDLNKIYNSMKEHVYNPIPRNSMHTTLLYSRKYLPMYEPATDLNEFAAPKKLSIWNDQVLVLELESEYLVNRHKELMKQHDATYDYDEYNPHITLSYNIWNHEPPEIDALNLPSKIRIVSEYSGDLNLNWEQ